MLRHILLLLALLCAPAAAAAQGAEFWFTTDRINPGLEAPAALDRDTPHATMEGFLDAARTEDWARAANYLNLGGVPEAAQRDEGETLARELHSVIDRKIGIPWDDLLDRPDALDARASSDSATAGATRRSILVGMLEVGDRPLSIRLSRIKPEDGPAVWLFSEQTVRNVHPLFDRYGPSLIEKQMPPWMRAEAIWGLFVWELLAVPVTLAIAVLAGWLTFCILSPRGPQLAARVLRAIRPGMTLIAFTAALTALSQIFVFSGAISSILDPLVTAGYVFALIWLLANAIDTIIDRLVTFDGDDLTEVGDGQEQKRELATRLSAARRALLFVVFVVGVGVILAQSNLARTLGVSLLASAGVIGLIFGFAARHVLGNILACLQISLNQSAKVGDKIMYEGYLCSVERIHFTYVQLRVWTGERLVVPVSEFVSNSFENWTMQESDQIRTVTLKLAHTADIDHVRSIYEEALDEIDGPHGPQESRGVHVVGQDVFGQDVLFKVPSTDPNASWAMACEARERIVAKARQQGTDARPLLPDVQAAAA
ncbi:MAG: mechanosensitive ion channel family protein [Shimia sp.]